MFGRHNNAGSQKAARSIVYKTGDGAAVSAANLQSMPTSLLKKTEAAGVSLTKKGLTGIRAQVVVVMDHSGSMYTDYANHKVQDLTERFLGFGLAVDIDGEVPVIPFDDRVKNTVNVNLTNYRNIVEDQIWDKNNMGSTDLAAALREVRKLAETTDAPLFVAIVTDGEPNDRSAAKEIVIDLARYPVFIKFLAVRPVRFLEELDNLGASERLLDNVNTKEYVSLDQVSDEQFADDMVDEWDSWVADATAAGILVTSA